MSAKFFGIERGESADFIYNMWKDMGLVFKDHLGDWRLTDLGKELGGGWSKSSQHTITFDKDKLLPLMDEFYDKFIKNK